VYVTIFSCTIKNDNIYKLQLCVYTYWLIKIFELFWKKSYMLTKAGFIWWKIQEKKNV